ncbi:hypothetical protein [Paenarthrobacter aurescens]|uniref:Uncharacterized protein n=1 Tax=Paenarthrobacter aurescens TaxID=43663 RepID=A0A4Y3NLB1_PAEAU|nr:hypothetical protein [Paenarthrobacter aurescens]MDO6145453.1 hypothetical protein [Paenarthrobacter aurescens]MDO6149261.1 hypothetical protein [Paenarthrobacter aurescens]MDO6160502.1 hypothetical protein [Paenarthrobacter aurescens]MDO6164361.1 hypothetical protein [Paenarthrobacter aurescens]GEB21255.1 hypothetical protein AAU01_40100 [Paenarthrobacter aurescens]
MSAFSTSTSTTSAAHGRRSVAPTHESASFLVAALFLGAPHSPEAALFLGAPKTAAVKQPAAATTSSHTHPGALPRVAGNVVEGSIRAQGLTASTPRSAVAPGGQR